MPCAAARRKVALACAGQTVDPKVVVAAAAAAAEMVVASDITCSMLETPGPSKDVGGDGGAGDGDSDGGGARHKPGYSETKTGGRSLED